ncbi:ParB/RepB/Spo0J family partition protein [Streptomyces hygroscopicus]|uniref:ParB/RepB/Spo0J family partition protein n=1 Tax=Streptomyces hygroscopicus TaxID=1912 RepID=UPI0036ACB370
MEEPHSSSLWHVRSRRQTGECEEKRSFAEVIIELLAFNPYNPREELTRIEETAESLKVKGQLQPLSVVRRHAFLEIYPEHREVIGQAKYVVIDGNRRLAAARKAGLTSLRIDVNDSLAESGASILESSLVANIHRVDVPPLDQARAIQGLLGFYKSQTEVAKRLGKSGAWVSQRLALLELAPDLQEKVEAGELRVKDARRIGRLPIGQQRGEADKVLNPVKGERKGRTKRPSAEFPSTPTPPGGGHGTEHKPSALNEKVQALAFSGPSLTCATAAMRILWELTGDIDTLADVLKRQLTPSDLGGLVERLVWSDSLSFVGMPR